MPLGSDYDIGTGIAPVNLATAANPGLRVFMGGLDELGVLFIGGAGGAADPPVLTLRQHTAASAGSSSNLAVVTDFWKKSEATLDNDEGWTHVTQAAGAVVTGTAQVQQMLYFVVRPEQMTTGPYISVDVGQTAVGAQVGTLIYIMGGMGVRDLGENMPIPLR
jgi:hypothetical protein